MSARLRDASCCDDHGLADPLRLEDNVLLDIVEATAVKALGLQLAKGNPRGKYIEPSRLRCDQIVGAIGTGAGGQQHVAVVDEAHGRVGDGCAQRIGHRAVHADGVQSR
jgi:hypothetical protein